MEWIICTTELLILFQCVFQSWWPERWSLSAPCYSSLVLVLFICWRHFIWSSGFKIWGRWWLSAQMLLQWRRASSRVWLWMDLSVMPVGSCTRWLIDWLTPMGFLNRNTFPSIAARKFAYLIRLPTDEHRVKVGISWLAKSAVDSIASVQSGIFKALFSS